MQTYNSGTDKRKYIRLARSVMISYKEAGSSEGYNMTSTKDISKGGTFFFSSVNYPIGTKLEMLVSFPFRIGKERTNVISKVVNVIKKNKFFGIGLEYIKMDNTVLSELHLFIDNLKKKWVKIINSVRGHGYQIKRLMRNLQTRKTLALYASGIIHSKQPLRNL